MKRAWVAGVASLILHAGTLGVIWQILSVPPDPLTPVLVELRPPVVGRLAPVRVSSQKRDRRPLPSPPEFGSPPPAAPEEVETDTPSPRPPSQALSAGPAPVASEPSAGFRGESPARSVDVANTAPTGTGGAAQDHPAPSRPSANREAPGGTGNDRVLTAPGRESTLSVAVAPSHPGPASDDSGFWRLLRSRVQAALVYPLPAVRRGLAGMVELEIRLRPDGSLEAIRVEKSSGHAILDQAAVRTVEEAAPFSLPDRRRVVVLLPIAFELR